MDEKTRLPRERIGKGLLAAALALTLLLPICLVLADLVHLRVVCKHYFVITWLGFLLTAGAALLLRGHGQPPEKGSTRMAVILLPASALNGLCSLLAVFDLLALLGAAACFFAAIPLFVRFAKTCRFKWIPGTLTAVTAGFTLFLLPGVLLGSLLAGERTTVYRVNSPNDVYVAEVISVDQGALGGNTLVEVRRLNRTADFFFIRVEDAPQRIYQGDYGEYEDMVVTWQDAQTVRIGKEAFSVK